MKSTDALWERAAFALPAPLTPLIGREQELARVKQALCDDTIRLVTLIGPGGVGKTRLALDVAHRLRSEFPDGAFFIDLTTITEPRMVLPLIAFAMQLDVRDTSTLPGRLVRELGDRSILLVMDNFEHVVEAGAEIANILGLCPAVKVLATSRMPLHVRGEQEVAVPPLGLPSANGEASDLDQLATVDSVQLFLQRAQAVQPNFELTSHNAGDIIEICHRLDGFPLAIELAASRTRLFPVKALRERLMRRLTLLTGGARDLPERLRTMEHAIQWSYDLLTTEEQELYRQLSVFQGAFSLEAAIGVCHGREVVSDAERDALVALLASLNDKSFLIQETSFEAEPMFRLFETIREFGMQQARIAGELDDLRRRHLHYYATLLAPMETELAGPRQALWLRRIDDLLPNLRYALRSASELGGDAIEDGTHLASSLWRYWMFRGFLTVGLDWLRTMLVRADRIDTGIRARATNNLGNLLFEIGEFSEALDLYERSRDMYKEIEDADGIADEWNNIGLIRAHQGDMKGARRAMKESLAIRQVTGDRTSLPTTLANLGDLAAYDGDLAEAEKYHLESWAIRKEIGNDRAVAMSCYHLGTLALFQREWAQAREWYEQGAEISGRVQDVFSEACLRMGLGLLDIQRRELASGARLLVKSISSFHDMGARRMLLEAIDAIAHVAAVLGYDLEAARLLGAGRQLRTEHPLSMLVQRSEWMNDAVDQVRQRLGQTTWERHQALGERWSLDEATSVAIELMRRVELGQPLPELPRVERPEQATQEPGALDQLTRREVEVLRQLARGLSDKEIATELSISPRTAMTHVSNILTKLKVNRRSAASAIAIRAGLVEPPGEG